MLCWGPGCLVGTCLRTSSGRLLVSDTERECASRLEQGENNVDPQAAYQHVIKTPGNAGISVAC
jgi:hypothetical protein